MSGEGTVRNFLVVIVDAVSMSDLTLDLIVWVEFGILWNKLFFCRHSYQYITSKLRVTGHDTLPAASLKTKTSGHANDMMISFGPTFMLF